MFPTYSRARSCLKTLLGITPYQHQSTAVAMMLAEFERSATFSLLMEMGTGKTACMLGAFGILAQRGEASTMLVACPSSVIGSWQIDAKRLDCEVLALTGSSAKSEAALQRALLTRRDVPLIVVINYEKTWRLEHALRAANFDAIVCDESQKIKAPGSKQSRAMHRIGKTAKYRVLMTGTIAPESALDTYAQMRFLDETLLGSSHVNFQAKYAHVIPIKTGNASFNKVTINKAMLPQLEEIIYSRAYRVSKEDALDLPDEVDVVVPFDLEPKARKIYDHLAAESMALLEDDFGQYGEVIASNILVKMLRLSQVCGGFASNEESGELVHVSKAKLDILRERLEMHLEAGRKIVVFHRFSREGEEIRRIAAQVCGSAKKPIEQPYVNGSVPTKDRADMIEKFQQDPDARVFTGQIQACGSGVTLHAAEVGIFFSMGFSAGDFMQARARYHRIGQSKKVTHEMLAARGTVDEATIEALMEKRSISDDLSNGGWRRYLGGG